MDVSKVVPQLAAVDRNLGLHSSKVKRFLVISIGNQAPYYNCLHSAGHFAIRAALASIRRDPIGKEQQPLFTDSNRFGSKCATSDGHFYTFLQSPTMMNNCGRFVRNAWQQARKVYQCTPGRLGLVVLHDELEADFGKVAIRSWVSSHKGHNGIKTIKNHWRVNESPEKGLFSRISIGIGRPASREPEDVSEYVLRDLSDRQRDIIETQVGTKVMNCLLELESKWGGNVEQTSPTRSTDRS